MMINNQLELVDGVGALRRLLVLPLTNLMSTLEQAHPLVVAALDAPLVDVLLVQPTTDALVALGPGHTALEQRARAHGLDHWPLASGGAIVEVFQDGDARQVDQAEEDGLPARLAQTLGIQSLLLAPVIVDGARRGVVMAASPHLRAFSPTALPFLETVAHWVGLLIQQSDLAARLTIAQTWSQWARTAISHAPTFLFAFDQAGVITVDEGTAVVAPGQPPRLGLGQSIFTAYVDVPQIVAVARRALAGEAGATQVALGAGVFEVYCAPVRDPTGEVTRVSGLAIDVTARIQAEAALTHQTLHDPLTGLPNRILFMDRLTVALAQAERNQAPLALLLLDLNRFKEVNDTFGHHEGDLLLQQVSQRLHQVARASDTVARLGGDEFAVLLPGDDQTGALQVSRRIRTALAAPFTIDSHAAPISASIGIALFPAHGNDGAALLRQADVAMYAAKHSHRGTVVYTAEQDQHSPDRLSLVGELRTAIDQGGLRLHYQPILDLGTGQARRLEVLARWPHPAHGLLPPARFIPLAESTGMMGALTAWVLETSLRHAQDWRQAGLEVDLSVNLSMSGLHDMTFFDTTMGLLQRFAVPPAALRLEITESALMMDVARTLEVLTRLASFGVRLTVDDFGTGYSSLALLKRLPVTELKIDRAFVTAMADNATDASIVRSTIGLGHGLGLQVVAEGVETRGVWDCLAALGCDAVQGYYLSRPLPAEAVASWLQRGGWHGRQSSAG